MSNAASVHGRGFLSRIAGWIAGPGQREPIRVYRVTHVKTDPRQAVHDTCRELLPLVPVERRAKIERAIFGEGRE